MGKTIYTLNVPPLSNNPIQKEITNITFPIFENYAKKWGAEFKVIDKSVYNKPSPTYEKFQMWELSRQRNDDFSIFIDADCLLIPSCEMPDWSELAGGDRVWSWGYEDCLMRYKMNDYFRRDGRRIAIGTFLFGFSKWTRDLVIGLPADMDWDIMEEQINITQLEENAHHNSNKSHYCDDYLTSLAIARYGLKHISATDICKKMGWSNMVYHNYLTPLNERPEEMKKVIDTWRQLKLKIGN